VVLHRVNNADQRELVPTSPTHVVTRTPNGVPLRCFAQGTCTTPLQSSSSDRLSFRRSPMSWRVHNHEIDVTYANAWGRCRWRLARFAVIAFTSSHVTPISIRQPDFESVDIARRILIMPMHSIRYFAPTSGVCDVQIIF
jgi:hypothetical protein